MFNSEILKLYKAKSGSTTIYQHNSDLVNILEQLNISEESHKKMLKIITFHDVGKVVGLFQDNLESKKREIRHEIISASVKDLDIMERIAILTHHKNLEYMYNEMDTLLEVDYYAELYISQLQETSDKLNIEMIDIRNEVSKYEREEHLLKDKYLIYLKGILNYCDHLASAGLPDIQQGIDIKDRYKFDSFTNIQKQAKNESNDILIVGATGSGKTEASLFWASNVDKNKDKRLLYILPFTASINAMYKRLKKEEFGVGMLHSKAQYFLSKELSDDSNKSIKFEYQTFKYFTKEITITTIHQIFKAMFNCKFNEMMLSMYKDSVFIIDEIHCFDERELAIILNTLGYLKDNYNIKVCIMSASIPTTLINLIKKELDIDTVLRLSREENSEIKRHTVYYQDKFIEDDINSMKKCYEDGKSLIVCTNTVKKAQEMYERLKEFVDIDDIVLLHSRFNQRDRERIESQLNNKKVLVGTQAIEVSLDIDYDEMFTEISPIDSQIQRWGRVNRKRVEKLIERKKIYIYNDQSNIYDKDIIERTKDLLVNIENVDENKVQEYLDQVYINDFVEYYEYKEICEGIFEGIQVAKWDNRYNEIVSFSGASVLPSCFIDEYEELVKEKEYLKANSLMVNITENKYNYARGKNTVDIEKGYIYYKYNSEVGLKFGEFDKFF